MPYDVDGFEITPLFSEEEIERLRSAVTRHMDRVSSALLKPLTETAPDAAFDERIERIASSDQSYGRLLGTAVATDVQRDPEVAALAQDPRLIREAERLCGRRVGDTIFRLRLNSSALAEHRQPWHSDVARVHGECATLITTAWIPLSDAGADTGGLEIVPGHQLSPPMQEQDDGRYAIDPSAVEGARTVIPTVRAGDCLFMDRFTPHRAVRNVSGRTRWSLVVWMKAVTGR